MEKEVFYGFVSSRLFDIGLCPFGEDLPWPRIFEIAVMVPNGVDPYFTAKRYGYETECEKLGAKCCFMMLGVMPMLTSRSGKLRMLSKGV